MSKFTRMEELAQKEKSSFVYTVVILYILSSISVSYSVFLLLTPAVQGELQTSSDTILIKNISVLIYIYIQV